MQRQLRSSRIVTIGALSVVSFVLATLLTTRTVLGRDSGDDNGRIVQGAGTTIIHGGTGSPNFVPVTTTIAFHAERSSGESLASSSVWRLRLRQLAGQAAVNSR